jgi:hypothetical protein
LRSGAPDNSSALDVSKASSGTRLTAVLLLRLWASFALTEEGQPGCLLKNSLLTHAVHFPPLSIINHSPCRTGEPGKEPLCNAVKGLISRSPLNLASHRRGLELEEIFPNGQTRHLNSSTRTAFPDCPFTRSYASPFNTFTHFVKLPSGALGWHWSPLISEERGYDLVHISMAIWRHVLLSMLLSPVAVRFGWS